MSKQKDILIEKSKGGANVLPQSKAAKKIFAEQHKGFENGFETDENQLSKILAWAVTHNLSVDSKLTITIPELPSLSGDAIVKALGLPKSFCPRKLFSIGKSKFKGGDFESVNEQFLVGLEYPVFESEGVFVVGKNGKAYKMTPACWTKIKSY